MRVLHLIDSDGIYGAEVVLLHLMVEQKKNDVDVILGSIGKPGIYEKDIELAAKQKEINIKLFRMRTGPNILGAISIIRFARKNNIDLIHCHGYKGNILMGMLPVHFRKIPYIITMHGWTCVKRFSKIWFYCWADALLAKRANLAVVVSETMLNHPRINAVGLKPVVVHNGIPPIKSPEKTPRQIDNLLSDFCSKGFIVGTIGRLSAEKGFQYLINAIADVISRKYNVFLVIIGEGGERQHLEDIIKRKGILNNVLITGYLNQANQYLRFFDIFVLSSLTEGLPITLLEAMQMGTTIIATKVGGIPVALDNGRCGALVEPGDVKSLSQAIRRLYDSAELRNELSSTAIKRVRGIFTSENMELSYRKLYEKVLNSN